MVNKRASDEQLPDSPKLVIVPFKVWQSLLNELGRFTERSTEDGLYKPSRVLSIALITCPLFKTSPSNDDNSAGRTQHFRVGDCSGELLIVSDRLHPDSRSFNSCASIESMLVGLEGDGPKPLPAATAPINFPSRICTFIDSINTPEGSLEVDSVPVELYSGQSGHSK